MSDFSPKTRWDESFHIFSEEQLHQLFLPKSAWKSDHDSTRCSSCNRLFFLFFRRKHHCRKCGNIFCSKCSNCFFDASSLKLDFFEERIRLCNSCYSKFADFKNFLTKEVALNLRKKSSHKNFETLVQEAKFQDDIEYINNSKASVFHQQLDLKLELLIQNIFKVRGISETYLDPLINLIKVAINEVRPNTVFWGDNMNINHYIKIKKILYPDHSETQYIRGVVFKKSLLDRKMPSSVETPRIFLFQGSIDCDFLQPNSKFGSFDSFITHEKSFFKSVARNILKMGATVILVEKTINRTVAETLKSEGVMVFVRVKKSLIWKIARLTRGRIITDFNKLDSIDPEEYIGKCSSVYVKRLSLLETKSHEFDSDSAKDFLFIEGCNALYGATITISGPDLAELKTLKGVLRTIFKIGRNWLLENCLRALDENFSEEINNFLFNEQLRPEGFNMEKLLENNDLFYTKVNFIKGDIHSIPDFSKNPFLIKELEISLDQDNEESVLRMSKIDYFAEICGYPSMKQIDFYSKEDISLGCYIILKANSMQSKCIACGKSRYLHISLYYQGSKYIKITSEYLFPKRTSPEQIQTSLEDRPSARKTSDMAQYNHPTPKKSLPTHNSPPGSTRHIETSVHSEKMDFSSSITTSKRFPLSIKQLKSSDVLGQGIGSDSSVYRTKTVGWSRESHSPTSTPKNSPINKRNTPIFSYIECSCCEERLTEVKTLNHEYLEFSLASFLQLLFESKTKDENDMRDIFAQQGEDLMCMHSLKTRVFLYDETVVKFFVGGNKYYKLLGKVVFRDERRKGWERQMAQKKSEEYYAVFVKTLDKLMMLIHSFKNEEEMMKSGISETLEILFQEIKTFGQTLKEEFQHERSLQVEVESLRINVARQIISFFDVLILCIRGTKRCQVLDSLCKSVKKGSLFSSQDNEKSPEEIIKAFLLSKKQNFFPNEVEEYVHFLNISLYDNEEKGFNQPFSLGQTFMLKYSMEPCEYLVDLEHELVLSKKVSDLFGKLFIEQQENFQNKFKSDEGFQIKHLEIEFREFLKMTAGQSLEHKIKNERSSRLFTEIPIDKQKPLGMIANALNSTTYADTLNSLAGKFERLSELLSFKRIQKPPIKSIHSAIEINICLIENFINTLSLIQDPKKLETESQFISQPNLAFPKQNKNIQAITVWVHLPMEFELLRKEMKIALNEFISSLAESAQEKAEAGKDLILKPHLTSHDGFFFLRSVKKRQFNTFLAIADKYFEYLLEADSKLNPSFLVRIFGAFQIRIQGKMFHYICSENLLSGFESKPGNWRLYDLKGSTINRYMPRDRLNRTLLDNNFKIDRNSEPIALCIEEKRDFDRGTDADLEFLRCLGLVDYSLLLVENREQGFIKAAIINFFTFFDEKKNEEKKEHREKKQKYLEKKRNGEEKLDPMLYAKRFRKSLRKCFMEIIDG